MVNVSGMSCNMPSPNEWMLEVISLNAISLLNGCLQRSKMTLLRMLRLLYILEWMRLKAILHQVCSVSFTAFINVCFHFCYRCSGMWNWNRVRIFQEFIIWCKTQVDKYKAYPSNVTAGCGIIRKKVIVLFWCCQTSTSFALLWHLLKGQWGLLHFWLPQRIKGCIWQQTSSKMKGERSK